MFNYNKLNCGFKKIGMYVFCVTLRSLKKIFSLDIFSDFIVQIYDVLKIIPFFKLKNMYKLQQQRSLAYLIIFYLIIQTIR